MNSQQLLYINIILGVLFLIYFLLGRSPQKAPTRLNLKNRETPLDSPENPTALGPISSQKNQHSIESQASKMTVLEPEEKNAMKSAEQKFSQKNLAIFFIYNGHDWEAHGVLGVPQGANLKTVTESYQKLLSESDSKSYDFFEAAYKAILKQKK